MKVIGNLKKSRCGRPLYRIWTGDGTSKGRVYSRTEDLKGTKIGQGGLDRGGHATGKGIREWEEKKDG